MGDTRKYRNIDALRTFGCLQNKNKKRFTKEEYKYIESVWNVKNYITGQHHFLVNFAPII